MQNNLGNVSSRKEPLLLQKKRLFQQQIRKQQKDQLISSLRERALMPEPIRERLLDLPNSLHELIKLICGQERLLGTWNKIISEQLFVAFTNYPSHFCGADVPVSMQVGLAIYIQQNKQLSPEQFDWMWSRLYENSRSWQKQQQVILLKLLAGAIETLDKKFLKPAKLILERNQDRFQEKTLEFYDFVIKRCPKEAFAQAVLTPQLFVKIIDHLKIFFYSPSEKIKMCQLLIQVLYQSNQEVVAKHWNLTRLFDVLEFFIASDTKLLIQRSLLLIFNVNIDCRSHLFLTHPCVQTVVQQMENDELPKEIRELMAETYLSALINLPRGLFPKYFKNQSKILDKALNYILQEFGTVDIISKSLEDILKMMIELDKDPSSIFRKWLRQRPQLLDYARQTEFGKDLDQQALL